MTTISAGLVLARRLSNAEYDYTIRDLTGQDLGVARQFPVDPAWGLRVGGLRRAFFAKDLQDFLGDQFHEF